MNLTPHFSLDELCNSATAKRLGIEQTPSSETMARLTTLAMGLEQIRDFLGAPMHISSGYRSKKLNALVGGAPDSAHVLGYAADFVCPARGTPFGIVAALSESGIKFDQLINEQTWVHVSFAPAMRQQVLTAHFNAAGRASYIPGVHS